VAKRKKCGVQEKIFKSWGRIQEIFQCERMHLHKIYLSLSRLILGMRMMSSFNYRVWAFKFAVLLVHNNRIFIIIASHDQLINWFIFYVIIVYPKYTLHNSIPSRKRIVFSPIVRYIFICLISTHSSINIHETFFFHSNFYLLFKS
jgi:hypothetical protein